MACAPVDLRRRCHPVSLSPSDPSPAAAFVAKGKPRGRGSNPYFEASTSKTINRSRGTRGLFEGTQGTPEQSAIVTPFPWPTANCPPVPRSTVIGTACSAAKSHTAQTALPPIFPSNQFATQAVAASSSDNHDRVDECPNAGDDCPPSRMSRR